MSDDELKLLAHADGELSAIAHGRPPSDKAELLRLSAGLRKIYDSHASGDWKRRALSFEERGQIK